MDQKSTSVLESTYIQKSRLFLLPLTGLKRGKFKETNTYISAPNLVSIEYPEGISFDDRIIVIVYSKDYKIKQDNIYNQVTANFKNINIEETGWDTYENTLMSNKNFLAFHETSDEFIYTFDLSDWTREWHSFMKGRYSQMSKKAKDIIKDYRWASLKPHEQRKLFCYLYSNEDETCFKEFAEQLEVPVEDLKKVKELCSKPNLNLETFKLSEKKELNET